MAAAARVRCGDVPDPVAGETAARRTVDRAEADLAAAQAAGARLLVPEDAAWPREGVRGLRARRRYRRSPRRWPCGCAGRARPPS